MIRAFILNEDGSVEDDASIDPGCRPSPGATMWVDLLEPTPEEVALLRDRWKFHPLAVEDVSHWQKRSKFERYPTHAFAVTQALDRSTDNDPLDTIPISIFLRPTLVVSVRPKDIIPIEQITRAMAAAPERMGAHADRILHAIIDAVIDEYTRTMYEFEARVDELEDVPANGRHRGPVRALVDVRRDLLMLRRMTLPQVELVKRFVDAEEEQPGSSARIWFRDVLDHLNLILEQTGQLLEICNGAIQVHMNATNERLNQVMKYLAIVNTLLLPMTVISGTFGMNFDVIPISRHGYGFWMAVGLMLLSAVVLLGVFKLRRWF